MKGVRRHLPKARIVFDHFHLMQMAGKALDEVCKLLRREGANLARDFRSFRNFRLMALLKAGKLRLNLPALSPS